MKNVLPKLELPRTPKEDLEVIIDGVPLDAPMPNAPSESDSSAKAPLLPTPALLPTPDQDPEKKVSLMS